MSCYCNSLYSGIEHSFHMTFNKISLITYLYTYIDRKSNVYAKALCLLVNVFLFDQEPSLKMLCSFVICIGSLSAIQYVSFYIAYAAFYFILLNVSNIMLYFLNFFLSKSWLQYNLLVLSRRNTLIEKFNNCVTILN